MAKIRFKLLDQEINDFVCGNNSVENMVYNAYCQTILQHGYAYQFCSETGIILGYYMVKFEKILLSEYEEILGDFYDDTMQNFFSVHIHFIAVDKKYQNRSIGTNVLHTVVKQIWELAQVWPVRLITIDALKDKYGWYIKNGFLPFDEKQLQNNDSVIKMYIDCQTDDNKERVQKYIEEREGMLC